MAPLKTDLCIMPPKSCMTSLPCSSFKGRTPCFCFITIACHHHCLGFLILPSNYVPVPRVCTSMLYELWYSPSRMFPRNLISSMSRKPCGFIMICFLSYILIFLIITMRTVPPLTSAGVSDLRTCRAFLIPEEVPTYSRACADLKGARQ